MNVINHNINCERKVIERQPPILEASVENETHVLVELKTRMRVRTERNRATLRPMKRYARGGMGNIFVRLKVVVGWQASRKNGCGLGSFDSVKDRKVLG